MGLLSLAYSASTAWAMAFMPLVTLMPTGRSRLSSGS